ncbi:myo-inositol 2-dehydrogenase [Sphaerotilus natans subsp. natans DSM 6575]|uniref:Inositol 2-dehydrogenase n=1 Tax=Sphaerotilus natans subsp. natans DSM 6575 TaxID=1286631 RepID=A0A059KT98_9BURK|nr:Gfo/Idh/MocA family oxidoreductase [Sphaerotilus natans]KDB54348.1 myo-inositol 2-dehydrogenase [Sphaerotilus natans subsp. natans DSM 6575]SIR07979.1 myo-inositol 2-dehydrogenase [Sphaerotilus natans]
MTLRIGIIGCGAIGQDHARRLHFKLQGATVVALNDIHREATEAFSEASGIRARVYEHYQDLIQAPDVDALLIASWGPAHEEQVLACIDAGKPVFCEKPLATSAAGGLRIVEAEVKAGRKLVQVGFMRRYDAGYRQLKQTLQAGTIGDALMVHCAHRNPSVPEMYVGDMNITDTHVHEIDVLRWLLDDDYVSCQVIEGRKSRHAHAGLHDPIMVLLETRQGIRIDTEIFVACRFGYDIQCHVVGETGVASLPEPMSVPLRSQGRQGGAILMDWKMRFIDSYDVELQAWIDDTRKGLVTGPTAWDGYFASATAEACVEARRSKSIAPVRIAERPDFYARA